MMSKQILSREESHVGSLRPENEVEVEVEEEELNMPTRLGRHKKLWLFIQAVCCLCAVGLVYQIGENILSLESAVISHHHHHHHHHLGPGTPNQGQGQGQGRGRGREQPLVVQDTAEAEAEAEAIEVEEVEEFFEDAEGLSESESEIETELEVLDGVEEGVESIPEPELIEQEPVDLQEKEEGEEESKSEIENSQQQTKTGEEKTRESSSSSSSSRARSKRVKRTVSELFKVVNDPELFRKSEFGYPVDLIVASQENLQRLNVHLSRPDRFLPKRSPFIPEAVAEDEVRRAKAVKYESCALVGNAGIARAAPFGASIDKHEVVMRINQGPSKDYESIVGSKTTYRLLNKKWSSMYTSAQEGRRVFLPNEARNSTILASRVSSRAFEHLASVVRNHRKDIRLLYVAQGLEARARNLLKAFKEASLKEDTPVRFEGGDAPSSGFIGFYFLLQICEKVAIYGFSSQRLFEINQRRWPYHYFRFTGLQGLGLHLDSEQLREHPHHSFDAEVQFYSSLSAQTNRTEACFPRGKFTRAKLMKCGVAKPEPEPEPEPVTEKAES